MASSMANIYSVTTASSGLNSGAASGMRMTVSAKGRTASSSTSAMAMMRAPRARIS